MGWKERGDGVWGVQGINFNGDIFLWGGEAWGRTRIRYDSFPPPLGFP